MPDPAENGQSNDLESLRNQLAELQGVKTNYEKQMADLRTQLERRNQQTEAKLTEHAEELGMLRRTAALYAGKAQPEKRRKIPKIDYIGDNPENVTAELIGTFDEVVDEKLNTALTEREKRLTSDLDALRNQVSELQFGMVVSRERDQLMQKYDFTDDEIVRAAEIGTKYGIQSLKAAAMLDPDLENKIATARLKKSEVEKKEPVAERKRSKPDLLHTEIDAKAAAREVINGTDNTPRMSGKQPEEGDRKAKLAQILATPGGWNTLPKDEREKWLRESQGWALQGDKKF